MSDIDEILMRHAQLIDKVIEKYIPREFTEKSIAFQVNKPRFAYDLSSLNSAIAKPIWDFLDRGGKRIRPTLFLLICEALGKNPEDFVDFAIIPEIIHNGTLIIDDIMTASEMRRGRPATYKIFGLDIATNAGNAMYYLSLLPLIEKKDRVSGEKLRETYEIYVQEMINLSFGQAMDISWHRGLSDAEKIDEKDYLQMSAYKNGTLLRMAARIAATLSSGSKELVEKLGKFAETIGVGFQIYDQILDLTHERFGKLTRGLDIVEGAITLPVIHTLKVASQRDKKALTNILRQHTTDQSKINEAISILNKYESIEYSRKIIRKLLEQSWQEVELLLPPSDAKQKLYAFVNFFFERWAQLE